GKVVGVWSAPLTGRSMWEWSPHTPLLSLDDDGVVRKTQTINVCRKRLEIIFRHHLIAHGTVLLANQLEHSGMATGIDQGGVRLQPGLLPVRFDNGIHPALAAVPAAICRLLRAADCREISHKVRILAGERFQLLEVAKFVLVAGPMEHMEVM